MRTDYSKAEILIRFREPIEEVKIKDVLFVYTEDDYLIVVTSNNKKYMFNRMYVISIEQLDEIEEKQGNTNVDTVGNKEMAKAELAKRELQRRRITSHLEKLNGTELNKLEKYLLPELEE